MWRSAALSRARSHWRTATRSREHGTTSRNARTNSLRTPYLYHISQKLATNRDTFGCLTFRGESVNGGGLATATLPHDYPVRVVLGDHDQAEALEAVSFAFLRLMASPARESPCHRVSPTFRATGT